MKLRTNPASRIPSHVDTLFGVNPLLKDVRSDISSNNLRWTSLRIRDNLLRGDLSQVDLF